MKEQEQEQLELVYVPWLTEEQLELVMFPWFSEENFDNRWRQYSAEECGLTNIQYK